MSTISANELTTTHYCKAPGCENEAKSPVGRYAYCAEHQGTARPAAASRNGSASSVGSTEQALRDLVALAKSVDRAKAKAEKLRGDANQADKDADALEVEYRDALAAATRPQ